MTETSARKQHLKLVADSKNYCFFIAYAIIFRLVITAVASYSVDMGGYTAWSDYLAKYGPSGLYGSSGFHIVYAPFFQYFLWLTGEIRKALALSYGAHAYLIKLWPVIFEFFGGFILIRFSEKTGNPRQGFTMALFYVLNPGVFMNSSVWGQFDSIPATMLLGVLCLFESKKQNAAALLFLVAVLTKPQSGLLLPVVLYLYFKDFTFSPSSWRRLVMGLLSGIMLYLAIVMPFYSPTSRAGQIPGFLDPFYWLFDLYSRSIGDYPYATANGFNFWFLLGGQVQEDFLPFAGLSYSWWGNILLVLAIIYAFLILVRGKANWYAISYFSFLVLFSAFFFMTRMHERYLFPAIIFAALCCLFDKRNLITAVLLSVCVFCNQLYIYIISFDDRYWLDRWDGIALFFSLLTLCTYALASLRAWRVFIKPSEGVADERKNQSNRH